MNRSDSPGALWEILRRVQADINPIILVPYIEWSSEGCEVADRRKISHPPHT